MEIIAKISKGTKMDQIYIPKMREGLEIGSYVIIKKIEQKEDHSEINKPFFYGLKSIEQIKLDIINKIFLLINKYIKNCDNIIITGSFLDLDFKFNDLDILLITNNRINKKLLNKNIKSKIGIKSHIIALSKKELQIGLSTDPLYILMLSKCVSMKRLIYKSKRKIDYKLLDLHLLKSEPLIHSFDITNGNEKYYLTRNLIAINLFIEDKKITKELIDKEIKSVFDLESIEKIKNNLLDKKKFLSTYQEKYKETQNKIFSLAKNDSK